MLKLLIDGGVIFTVPMTILFMINILLIAKGAVYIIKHKFQNQHAAKRWIDPIKYIGIFLLSLGILGQLIGLYSAFDAIAQKKILIDAKIMIDGIRVSSITTILGLTYFVVSYGAWLLMDLKLKNSTSQTGV